MASIAYVIPAGTEEFLEVASKLVGEADIAISPTGIQIREMDLAHIALVDLAIGNPGKEVSRLRVNLGFLAKAISRGLNSLEFDTETKKLVLHGAIEKLSMNTMEPNGEEIPTPKVQLNVKNVSLGLVSLRDIQKLMGFSQVRFKGDGKVVSARAESDFANYETWAGSYEGEAFEATYSFGYLEPLAALEKEKLGVSGTWEFASRMPLHAVFSKGLDATMSYWLAPRIEEADAERAKADQPVKEEAKTEQPAVVQETTPAAVSA